MAFVSDTFTGVSGTSLDAHSGETGATWVEHGSYATGSADISDANRLRANAVATCMFYASGAPASADYDVEAVVRRLTTVGRMGVAARVNTAADTMYVARYDTTGVWEILKLVAGSATSLGAFSQTLTANTDYALKFELRGTALKLYVNGVERISTTDAAITAAGKVGIRASTGSNTTGVHLDTLVATDAIVSVGRSFAVPYGIETRFVEDSLTDTDAVALQSHTVEIGGPWTRHTSYATNADIRSNRARIVASAGTARYTAAASPPSAEFDFGGTFVQRTAEGAALIGGRCSDSANTGYFVRYTAANGLVELVKIATGTTTVLGSVSHPLVNGESVTVKCLLRDAVKTVEVDGGVGGAAGGVERITSADNAITAVGKVGVGFTGPGGTGSGIHIDEVWAGNPGPSPVGRSFAVTYQLAGTTGRSTETSWRIGAGAVEVAQRAGRRSMRGGRQPFVLASGDQTLGLAGRAFVVPYSLSGTVGRAFPFPYSLLPAPGAANVVYISETAGDDTRSLAQAKDPATPWRSFTKAYADTPDEAGWVVYVRGGNYVTKAKFVSRNTRAHMLTYRGMPGETVVLDRTPGITTAQKDLRAVVLQNSKNIRFEGFQVIGGGYIAQTGGGQSQFVEFVNNDFSAYEMTVENARDVLFDSNIFDGYVGSGRKAITTASSATTIGAVRLTITNNIFRNIEHDALAMYWRLEDLLIEDNYFENILPPAGSGIHSDCIQIAPNDPGTAGFVIVRRNRMHNIAQAILVKDGRTDGLLLDSNICGYTPTLTWSCMVFSAPSAVIVHNTFTKAFHCRISSSSNVTVANNIMSSFSRGAVNEGLPSFAVANYNLIGATNGYQHVTGPNDIIGTPTYTDLPNGDYELQPGSLGLNTGSPAHDTPLDALSRSRPFGAAPDRGALERQS